MYTVQSSPGDTGDMLHCTVGNLVKLKCPNIYREIQYFLDFIHTFSLFLDNQAKDKEHSLGHRLWTQLIFLKAKCFSVFSLTFLATQFLRWNKANIINLS